MGFCIVVVVVVVVCYCGEVAVIYLGAVYPRFSLVSSGGEIAVRISGMVSESSQRIDQWFERENREREEYV